MADGPSSGLSSDSKSGNHPDNTEWLARELSECFGQIRQAENSSYTHIHLAIAILGGMLLFLGSIGIQAIGPWRPSVILLAAAVYLGMGLVALHHGLSLLLLHQYIRCELLPRLDHLAGAERQVIWARERFLTTKRSRGAGAVYAMGQVLVYGLPFAGLLGLGVHDLLWYSTAPVLPLLAGYALLGIVVVVAFLGGCIAIRRHAEALREARMLLSDVEL